MKKRFFSLLVIGISFSLKLLAMNSNDFFYETAHRLDILCDTVCAISQEIDTVRKNQALLASKTAQYKDALDKLAQESQKIVADLEQQVHEGKIPAFENAGGYVNSTGYFIHRLANQLNYDVKNLARNSGKLGEMFYDVPPITTPGYLSDHFMERIKTDFSQTKRNSLRIQGFKTMADQRFDLPTDINEPTKRAEFASKRKELETYYAEISAPILDKNWKPASAPQAVNPPVQNPPPAPSAPTIPPTGTIEGPLLMSSVQTQPQPKAPTTMTQPSVAQPIAQTQTSAAKTASKKANGSVSTNTLPTSPKQKNDKPAVTIPAKTGISAGWKWFLGGTIVGSLAVAIAVLVKKVHDKKRVSGLKSTDK